MKEFKELVNKNNGRISTKALKGYKMIGKGNDGSVYQVSTDKCVKIFVNEKTQKEELFAYQMGKSSSVIPKLFEYGTNYIVIEYVNGTSLKEFLKKEKKISEALVIKILFMLDEFKRISFTRRDTQIRHILLNDHGEIKVIDLKRAFNRKTEVPSRLLKDLGKLGFLETFLKHVKKLRPSLYKKWKE
ncbi:lipopolysaccharide kinase InaA family protein [Neobacillus sp. NRS-1170]|uniref:lipopolysaccharide kinase InaA family protein n=1 Tax=Neobacillus sp. NRS-1170 TaxID=3233898 RepID=UPI003D2E0449